MVVNRQFRPSRFPSSSRTPRAIPASSTWSASIGNRTHLAGELFKMMAGVDMVPDAAFFIS